MLSTLLEPTNGSIEVFGEDARVNPLAARRAIGYLPDFFNLYGDLLLWEMLHFFADAYGAHRHDIKRRIGEALNYVGLYPKRNDFARNLSRGMSQRLGVATLLVRDSAVLLLDEPASGLDPRARIELRKILKKLAKEGKTIVISSHILTELDDFCTHIAVMGDGKLKLHGDIASVHRELKGKTVAKIRVLDKERKVPGIVKRIKTAEISAAEGKSFEITLDGGEKDVADLNKALVSAGIDVVELGEEKTSMEDIFMDITQEMDEDASEGARP
jgi:ABC-2 type transport system ATP-binding protein